MTTHQPDTRIYITTAERKQVSMPLADFLTAAGIDPDGWRCADRGERIFVTVERPVDKENHA